MSPRAWALVRAIGLGVTVVMLSPVDPLVLVFLPLAVLLLAFRRDDALALGLAGLILLVSFLGFPRAETPLWFAERGWSLAVAGGFVAATALLGGERLVLRAVAGVGTGFATGAAAGLLRPALLAELDWWVGREIRRAAGAAGDLLESIGPEGASWLPAGPEVARAVEWQVMAYPALLALASVAALAVGWYVLQRLGGGSGSLGPLREFRFQDELVWVLIAGLLLLVVPTGELVDRIGENAMLFMGGLYLLRGVGVLLWLGAATVSSGWLVAFWALAAVLLYPLAVGAALLLGLGDTWVDVRDRLGGARPAGRR